MREIKFRAWIKEVYENGEFAYGGYMVESDYIKSVHVNKSGTLMNGPRGTGIEYFVQGSFLPGMGHHERARFDEIELMQYTGLKDKNNKEIYEGDIVQYESTKLNGSKFAINRIVEFNNGRYMLGLHKNLYDVYRNGEVIGNIYENPELLAGERE